MVSNLMDEYIKKSDIGLTDFEIILCKGDYKEALLMLFDKIKHLPAADVRPVVRGRWNAVKGALHPAETSAVCSNCGFATMIHAQTFYNFCPTCGADMHQEPQKEE